jgi:hypothetical protein
MKRVLVLLGLVMTLLVTAGCGLTTRPQVVIPDGMVPFDELQPEQLTPDVKAWVSSVTSGKTQPLSEGKTFGEQTYLLVYAGERPTGGYTVTFQAMEAKGGALTVKAAVLPPGGSATQTITYPMGVARIARHDGRVMFDVVEVATSPAPPGLPPITTGNVQIDPTKMKQLQQQVDQGHQPWRLDPLQVAMAEGQEYGFNPAAGDKFALIRQVDVGPGSGTGEAYVKVTRPDGSTYEIELIQPNGPGKSSIWTINAIRELK